MIYRRSLRLFARIDGDTVTLVLLKEKSVMIEVSENWLLKEETLDDPVMKESNAVEFNEAYSKAIEELNKVKV